MQFLRPISTFKPSVRFIQSKRNDQMYMHHLNILTRVKVDRLNEIVDIPNDHPLMKAVKMIVAITDEPSRAYELAKDQAPAIASTLKWFGGTGNGELLEKPYFFLDKSTPEAILLVNNEDSMDSVITQVLNEDKEYWTSWEPVKVRYHVYTDMDYYPLSIRGDNAGRYPTMKHGINIIEVDLPLLFMQYWYWYRSKISKVQTEGGELVLKPIGSFFMSYPLTNAIERSMEIAYFNRTYCYFTGQQIETSRQISKRHAYIDTYKYVDDSIMEVLMNYKKHGGMTFSRIISNLPSLTQVNYGTLFSLPDILLLDRTLLILCYSVVPLYEIWLKLVYEKQFQKWNTSELADLKKGWKVLNNRNMFQTVGRATEQRFREAFSVLTPYIPK